MADASLDISELLDGLGFDTPGAQARARAVLEAGKLTRPGKARIDGAKRTRLEALLEVRFFVSCGAPDCDRAAGGREVVRAARSTACRVCEGSANRRAVVVAARAFALKNVRRIVVVGGSPSVHDELTKLKPAEWELRLVDGTSRRTLDLARADVRWADLVLVWGSSELDHKVSEHYTRETDRSRLVTVNRRGIAALLDAATIHVSRR